MGIHVDAEGRWIEGVFAAIDRKDSAAFADFLSADACFRFGNAPPILGRKQIAGVVEGFLSSLEGLRHRLGDRWILPDAAIVTGIVNYIRLDGSELEVPFANVLKFRSDDIHDYRIYVDNSDLFPVDAA